MSDSPEEQIDIYMEGPVSSINIDPKTDENGQARDCRVVAELDGWGTVEMFLHHPGGRELAVYLDKEKQRKLGQWLLDCADRESQ